jgi:hypothetical protein
MAFVATQTIDTIMGNQRVTAGTYINDATSGTLVTGLRSIKYVEVTGATRLAVNADGTVAVTIPSSGTTGFWKAFGDC